MSQTYTPIKHPKNSAGKFTRKNFPTLANLRARMKMVSKVPQARKGGKGKEGREREKENRERLESIPPGLDRLCLLPPQGVMLRRGMWYGSYVSKFGERAWGSIALGLVEELGEEPFPKGTKTRQVCDTPNCHNPLHRVAVLPYHHNPMNFLREMEEGEGEREDQSHEEGHSHE